MAQRQGNLGQSHLLDRDIHWSESSLQSLLDHLISALEEIGRDAGVDGFEKAPGALYPT
jgi:hypothetical protein